MKRMTSLLLVICLSIIFLTSCSSNSLAGTWRGDLVEGNAKMGYTMTLKADGSGQLKVTLGTADNSTSISVINEDITYKVEEGKLYLFKQNKEAFGLFIEVKFSYSDYGMAYTQKGNTLTIESPTGTPLVLKK